MPIRGRIDAVVLAGGRGSRLGGVSKAGVEVDGRTLAARAIDAALRSCRRVAVVVDPRAAAEVAPWADDARVTVVVEDAPYAGPAVALRRGLAALPADEPASDSIIVLACDLAQPDAVVELLTAQQLGDDADGLVLVDPDGRRQWVAGRYGTAALAAALTDATSLRGALGGLRLTEVPASAAVCADVDTPADLDDVRARIGR